MKNKKGFTLIELLAVIVILAIIALIATPIVLNMINNARKSAAKSGALGFISSIEAYAGFSEIDNTGISEIANKKYSERVPVATKTTGTGANATTVNVNVVCEYDGSTWLTKYQDNDSSNTIKEFGEDENSAVLTESTHTCAKFFGTKGGTGVVDRSKGKLPTKASVVLDQKGKVQNKSWFIFNKYKCTYDGFDIPNNGCVSSSE